MVVSLPSEKVPAPPSPNWTFDSVLSLPVSQNSLTSFTLSSILLPLSRSIGLYPISESTRPAKSPAGPVPTITGLDPLMEVFFSYSLFSTLARDTPFLPNFFNMALSLAVLKSTVYTNEILLFLLASTDFFQMRQAFTSFSLILNFFDISEGMDPSS